MNWTPAAVDRPFTRFFAGCVCLVVLTTPLPGQSMFRGDAGHSGVCPSSAPRIFHRVKWKFPTGNRIVSSPVFADGRIYFGGDDGYIYAVNAETGVQAWKYPTAGPVPATPAVANGVVYAGSYDGKFYAVEASTGLTKWKFATEGERRFEAKGIHGLQPKNQTIADQFDVFLSSPVMVNGSVFFGSGDGHVYALSADSGELRWKFKTGDVVHSSPGYADGTLYFGSWDSYFYAVDAATGKERWRLHGGEDALIHNQVGFQSHPRLLMAPFTPAAGPRTCTPWTPLRAKRSGGFLTR